MKKKFESKKVKKEELKDTKRERWNRKYRKGNKIKKR